MMGREGPPDEKRFSDRVFAHAAVAFAIVAVHAGSLGDTASACTAATTDSEGRFSFSGFKVGVGRCQVGGVSIFSLPLILCRMLSPDGYLAQPRRDLRGLAPSMTTSTSRRRSSASMLRTSGYTSPLPVPRASAVNTT